MLLMNGTSMFLSYGRGKGGESYTDESLYRGVVHQ